MDKQKRLCEIYVSSFILAVSAYLLRIAYTSKIRSNVTGMNAMIFPKIILYLIIILCLYLIVNSIFKLAQEKAHSEEYESTVNFKETPFISKKIIYSIALILLYAIAWPNIGFILSSIIFVFFESRMLDSEKPWWSTVIIAMLYTLLIYLIFNLGFGVTLPEPLLSEINL